MSGAPYRVLLTPEASESYLGIRSQRDIETVRSIIRILDTVPGIGREYDPLYEAEKPDIDGLMVAYAGHFGIHYVVDGEMSAVKVLAIIDQRRDPLARFSRSGL